MAFRWSDWRAFFISTNRASITISEGSDQLMNDLLAYHKKTAQCMARETSACERIDPEYFSLATKYKTCLLVQAQLLRRSNHSCYEKVYAEAKAILDKPLVPLWNKFIAWQHEPEIVMEYFDVLRNSFYARANFEKMTYPFLRSLLTTAKLAVEKVLTNRDA